jgi:hypothetical protein
MPSCTRLLHQRDEAMAFRAAQVPGTTSSLANDVREVLALPLAAFVVTHLVSGKQCVVLVPYIECRRENGVLTSDILCARFCVQAIRWTTGARFLIPAKLVSVRTKRPALSAEEKARRTERLNSTRVA